MWRRRQCKACKAVFTTHEAIDLSTSLLVRSGASTKPFLADKLFADFLLVMKHRPDRYTAAREATYTTVQNLIKLPSQPLFEKRQISACAADVLKKLDKRAYLHYAADHPSLQV